MKNDAIVDVKEHLQYLKSNLVMVKSLKSDQAQQEFYRLLQNAKQKLGQLNPYIANFYFEYGSFLLSKMERNLELLNAGAVPEGQNNQDMDSILQAYDEDSDELKNGANGQKVDKTQQNNGNIEYKDQNVEIVEDKKQRMQQKPLIPQEKQNSQKKQDLQQDIDDNEIIYDNLSVALTIYQKQKQLLQSDQQSLLPREQICQSIVRIHQRLADFFLLTENFPQAIDQFNSTIKHQSQRQDSPYNRRIGQCHYMIGNCYLYDNKDNCEKFAIREYVEAIKILIKHLEVTQKYNVSRMEIPSQYKVKVDRFAYLSYPNDSALVKDIKEVCSCLLDKIQDSYAQFEEKGVYQKQKIKINKEKQQNNTFKEVSKDVKVTHLGTFGNRKKNPSGQITNSIQLKNVPSAPSQYNSQQKQNENKTLSQQQQKNCSIVNEKKQQSADKTNDSSKINENLDQINQKNNLECQ